MRWHYILLGYTALISPRCLNVHKDETAYQLPLMASLWLGLLLLFIGVDFLAFQRQMDLRLYDALYANPFAAQASAFNQRAASMPEQTDLTLFNPAGELLDTTIAYLPPSGGAVFYGYLQNHQHETSCLQGVGELGASGYQVCYQFDREGNLWLASIGFKALLANWLANDGLYLALCLLGFFSLLLLYLHKHVLNQRHKLRSQNLHALMEKNTLDYQRLITNLPGLFYRVRVTDGEVLYVSPGAEQLTGYSPEAFRSGNIQPLSMVHRDDKKSFIQQSRSAHHSMREYELTYRIITRQGDTKWVLDKGRCYLEGNDPTIEGMILDITERELVRQQIEYLAVQDPLTELFNRYKFHDELVHLSDAAKASGEAFAMLFIDLDRFKNINDSLGHQVGDRLLRKVAQRLKEITRGQFLLARMGGDEFVVLMRHLPGRGAAAALAAAINQSMATPYRIDNYQLRTSCSIGIALFPEHSEQSQVLWRYADTAMYQVKQQGGDDYQFFTPEIGAQVQQRISMEHDLGKALENSEFFLQFQPQIDLENGRVCGAEALIRWQHPQKGLISPAQFIPIAEEIGLINKLGDWILDEALRHLQLWLPQDPQFTLAVNISAKQVTAEFPGQLQEKLQRQQTPAHALELEITESLLMENLALVTPLLNEIRKQGISFALDDFGTGYSSLSYLRHLPIQKLKIDRAFVKNLETNNDDAALVNAIIAMARSLNLNVLAEGVESDGQKTILQRHGCQLYQGYLFGKPVNAADFAQHYLNRQIIR